MSKKLDIETLSTAYHEVGHAVISYRMVYVNCGSISIIPGNDYFGSPYVGIFKGGSCFDGDDELNAREREIIVLYSGFESELLINPFTKLETSESDFNEAEKLYNLFSKDMNHSLNELKKIASIIVKENEYEIKSIVKILIDKKFLKKDEWQEIISEIDFLKWKKNNPY